MDFKINPFLYSHNAVKIDYEGVTIEDLIRNKAKVNDPINHYVLPKEFAGRLSAELKLSKVAFPFKDVPLTNRNLIESHLFTRCKLLLDSDEVYPLLVDAYNHISQWGEISEIPADYTFFSNLLTVPILTLLKDRVRHIPTIQKQVSSRTAEHILTHGGITRSIIFGELIKFINKTKNFKYQKDVVGFLSSYCNVGLVSGFFYIRAKNRIRQGLNCDIKYNTTSTNQLIHFLFTLYIGQHKQWFESGTWLNIDGTSVYVDHHTLIETRCLNEYIADNKTYPHQLPFGIAPALYFAEKLHELALRSYKTSGCIKYPKDFPAILDLSDSPHRQLTTGLDLVSEGVVMSHCVGGDNYQNLIKKGDALFFHLDIPDITHGATLSLDLADEDYGKYELGGLWWVEDQFYGYDDEYVSSNGHRVKDEFLKTYFKPRDRKKIRSVYPTMGGLGFVKPPLLKYQRSLARDYQYGLQGFRGFSAASAFNQDIGEWKPSTITMPNDPRGYFDGIRIPDEADVSVMWGKGAFSQTSLRNLPGLSNTTIFQTVGRLFNSARKIIRFEKLAFEKIKFKVLINQIPIENATEITTISLPPHATLSVICDNHNVPFRFIDNETENKFVMEREAIYTNTSSKLKQITISPMICSFEKRGVALVRMALTPPPPPTIGISRSPLFGLSDPL